MTPSVPVGELRALGDRALLIGVADATAGRALASTLAGAFDGAADVVCGTATVMVHATDPDAELRPLWGIAAGMVAGMAEEVVESRPQGHAAGARSRRPGWSRFRAGSTAPTWRRWPRWRAVRPTTWRRS